MLLMLLIHITIIFNILTDIIMIHQNSPIPGFQPSVATWTALLSARRDGAKAFLEARGVGISAVKLGDQCRNVGKNIGKTWEKRGNTWKNMEKTWKTIDFVYKIMRK